MDVSSFFAMIWDSALIKIVPFLFVLTVIVFFHELGHFLVGRLCGIRVLAFSVGFGPELVGFNDSHGTRWKFCAIPLGGYVKFLGDENVASTPDRAAVEKMDDAERSMAFPAKSVGRRAATVAAGPIANFILAIAIFAGVAYFNGRVVGDPVVAEVRAESPAAEAGVLAGDRIVALDGNPVAYFSDILEYVSTRADVPIAVEVERAGGRVTLQVTPRTVTQTDGFGNEIKGPLMGLVATRESAAFRTEKLSALQSIRYGAEQTWFFTHHTASFIGGIFTGNQGAEQIGGPIRIAGISSQVATLGFSAILILAAQLSISIGLLNLVPIPMLDGGHLLFYAFEALRGRPLSEKVQEVGFRIGIVLVLSLMLFAVWNDITWLT
ncbi:putative zinc metalloprotease R01501 [Aureimonas sp. SA4125]|uniref:RIP metalloprotease RseP n=1 Tax=Aureimonas sp. SA4125 TaxID=2826993 RepID=UPI001CC730D3|nr:RIP metalloprotease RseP [Aureimonas sp. SA4125]BDA84708.1 putative zinc metalloprotease R01501 [Aureimonas sp. SA4125]